jgi:anti-sigma B factor antagonist
LSVTAGSTPADLANKTQPTIAASSAEPPVPRQSNHHWSRRIAVTEPEHSTNAGFGQLEIVVAQRGATTTIAFSGEWDLAEQHTTRQAIRSALASRHECIVLDLSQLSFIDTSAIHVMLELQNRSAQENIRLVIAPGRRAVQRPLEVLGLTAVLPFLNARTW